MSTNEFNVPYKAGAVASSLVLRTKPGGVMGIWANSSSAAVYIMLLDAIAAPSNGDISATPLVFQMPLSTTSGLAIGQDPPWAVTTGAVIVASTTAYPTLTLSATTTLGGTVR